DDENARAVRLALQGDYAHALQRLPAPDSAERRISRTVLRANRDVIAYWQQRRRFAGSLAVPDPHIGYRLLGDITTLSSAGWHRRFGRVTQTVEVDAAGLRIRIPYDTTFDNGQRNSSRGETEITLQAFAGKASQWPDTKLSAGIIALVHRSEACADSQDPRADLFAAIAHRHGRVAATFVLGAPTEMGKCAGPCLVGGDLWAHSELNLLVHSVVQPTVGLSAAGWFADARGAVASLSPGLRLFLVRSGDLRVDATQHTTLGEVDDVSARRTGAELTVTYRWW
ncbi:MAG: hypothetical protein ACOC1F_12495, partial [Myxococcota bacterium]